MPPKKPLSVRKPVPPPKGKEAWRVTPSRQFVGKKKSPPPRDLVGESLKGWLDAEHTHHLCFGGAGDALLTIAACYRQPRVRVLFCANEDKFAPQFFPLFDVPVLVRGGVIMGQPIAAQIYARLKGMVNFHHSAHLPEGLDINDWGNDPYKYRERLVRSLPWVHDLGAVQHPRPAVVICPSGSSQDPRRQRYLSVEEYRAVVARYLRDDFLVYTTGSPAHQAQYGLYPDPSCFWLSSSGIIRHDGASRQGDLRSMLQVINGAAEVVSTDTWLKTYSLLCGIPTKVVLNRFNGHYRMVGSDQSDPIFLNNSIWPAIRMYRVQDLLASPVEFPEERPVSRGVRMATSERFDEAYYLRGPETGVSNYSNYRWLPELTVPMACVLKRFLGATAGERLLDFGCARGYMVKALRLLQIDATGVDVSSWAITNCDPDVKEFVGHAFDEAPGSYEHIFCKDVLEHIPEESLLELLPRLFRACRRSALFIVPLAAQEGGAYLYPGDEKDATHIHRKTLDGWRALLQAHAKNFVIMGTTDLPVLKMSAQTYPGSAGFLYCRRFEIQDTQAVEAYAGLAPQ